MDDVRWRLRLLFLPALESYRESCWCPRADVHRTRDGWLVKLDLAGVHPEDVQLLVQGRQLTVCGTRRDSIEEGCDHYQMEIDYSRFERVIELPCDLERARTTVEHQEGMVLVRFRCDG